MWGLNYYHGADLLIFLERLYVTVVILMCYSLEPKSTHYRESIQNIFCSADAKPETEEQRSTVLQQNPAETSYWLLPSFHNLWRKRAKNLKAARIWPEYES